MESFDSIYKRYSEMVYKQCFSMTKNHEVAKDFTQEIFIKVFVKLNTFQSRSDFSTWLYSVAYNYCIDQLRLTKRLRTEFLSDSHLRNVPESDHAEVANVQLQDLELVMEELRSEDVEILRLKYEKGVSIKSISQQYNISESAIKMRLMRTRIKLQSAYSRRFL
ncbi:MULTISPECIES: RNA polymerase sigma factor [Spirosoma]|uniref:Sigma-70 family RNA polymerase sigma factor n=1 Tax=Spirosoma liriopis TaxID=2937440 RepID=A0ABT0HU74_9BACT|nr:MULTISPECIES: sigma-70 family RNA polymerase sigma factor [Spirosoma]MCK8495734.1 sigma-70 family RNA polymerase sigma factor [Spirosoma liriopis]UHG94844.1 sigma-70 family RNA polymerase sigma factor [Spirosoma oryzicola]